jgi:hypothetical protein
MKIKIQIKIIQKIKRNKIIIKKKIKKKRIKII